MEKEIALVVTNFRNVASKIYEMIFNDFRRSIAKLDRQTDENVFQQLQARYVNELEKHLDQEAKKIVEENSGHAAASTMHRELAAHISYLISSFLLKAKSM